MYRAIIHAEYHCYNKQSTKLKFKFDNGDINEVKKWVKEKMESLKNKPYETSITFIPNKWLWKIEANILKYCPQCKEYNISKEKEEICYWCKLKTGQ